MVGVGLRSNVQACKQLMAEDLLGTRWAAAALGVARALGRRRRWGGNVNACGEGPAHIAGLAANRTQTGRRRFAVVRDDFDKNQDRMHLDCVFSLLSDSCCLMLEDIMGDKSPKRRLVSCLGVRAGGHAALLVHAGGSPCLP
jgi:arginine deiminase